MLNSGCLIPMFRMLFLWPMLWIARFRRNRRDVIWFRKRLQYEDYCLVWWDSGGPVVGWKEFQKRETRREIRRFYNMEFPREPARRTT